MDGTPTAFSGSAGTSTANASGEARTAAYQPGVPYPMGFFGLLALLFVVVPILELVILIQLGQAVGLGLTLLLVLATGIGGAMLARAEGLRTLLNLQKEVASGAMPDRALMDGAAVLVGGALLLTPGLLTDLVGFSLLVPFTRRIIGGFVRRRLSKMVAEGSIRVVTVGPAGPFGPPHPRTEEEVYPPLDPSKEIAIESDS